MADNVTIDTITGSPVAASDEIGGVHFQRVKLIHGTNGTNDGDVSTSSPLPIGDAGGSLTVDDGGTSLTVDGTVGVSGSVAVTGDFYPVTQPVSGTVAATQSGTWNVGTVASVTAPVAVTGTFYQATQPVSGTFYQATQPVSIASAVPITDNSGSLTVDAPVTTPAFVRLSDGSAAITTLPVSVASIPSHAVTNAGVFATQVDGAALTSLQLLDDTVATTASAITTKGIAVSGTDGTNARVLKTDSSGELQVDVLTLPTLANVTTVATVSAVTSITNALPAGTNAIGKLAANSGVDIGDVDVTSISAGSNLIGDVGIQGRTTGGISIFRSIDLDETEEEAKGSAGTLYSLDAMNMTASPLYLKVYDGTAASVTVGSTTPVLTYVLPTNGDTNGCGMVKTFHHGFAFSSGITVAVTTGLADNNTGAPAANAAIVNIGYK